MLTTAIFPSRYVQGADALTLLPEEIRRFGVVALAIVDKIVLPQVSESLSADAGVSVTIEVFGGECSDEEVERLSAVAKAHGCAVIIGAGGGKTLDTAKAVAYTAKLPVVIIPTLASTDAPCSALSVIYTPEGAFKRYLVLTHNPDVVLVDTNLIVRAPVRFLVSGMGDALSTWFEAEDCRASGAVNMTGRQGTMSAYALARLCYDTLLANGAAAKAACESRTVTPAFENIVEANTLLSGLGFESGGLSGAHAIHNGLTSLHGTHAFWHGEKVAIGAQALIMLTHRPAKVVDEVFHFCTEIGLPTKLADIGLEEVTDDMLMQVAKVACAPEDTMGNVPGNITPENVVAAIRDADAEGRRRTAVR